jgi:hypothetical protein
MLKALYGDRADEILQHRWQIIKYVGPGYTFPSVVAHITSHSAWRPLKGPLFDWPLAVCDARSFDQGRDAQVADAVYSEWAYENVLVHHHPDQRWYYFPAMRPDETMLFKCADSDGAASGRE